MSEYQYYEFQVVDRSLTREQMSELRNYSSRAKITADRFVNVYNYGSFKGHARQSPRLVPRMVDGRSKGRSG
jgi:hypothetical protein